MSGAMKSLVLLLLMLLMLLPKLLVLQSCRMGMAVRLASGSSDQLVLMSSQQRTVGALHMLP
eukprot:5904643-Amphidinium_carterae.1